MKNNASTDNRDVFTDTEVKLEQAQKKLAQAEMLLGISRRIAAIDNLDEVLSTLLNVATEELGAQRGSLFLNDAGTEELYSRVAQGGLTREIRIMNNAGIAGAVFTSGQAEIISRPYDDPRFSKHIDEQTGFRTENILCAPLRTARGNIIGVTQILNKNHGQFTADDLALLAEITIQASVALQSSQFVEYINKNREKELKFLDLVADITSELDLGPLLTRVMSEATRMLNAERGTLFLSDEKSGELFSRVAMGESMGEIRLPNTAGIAGTVFTSGESVNIPYAYADLRFNPAFDRQTGFFTRSILCVPIINKFGKCIGVTQVLNKKGGVFSAEDESRLKAFTAQVSIALENAKLFDDIQNMKNYSEGMLQSMSNGVITLDENQRIITCNRAGLRIMGVGLQQMINHEAADYFGGKNAWILDKVRLVLEAREPEIIMEASLHFPAGLVSANVNVVPLQNSESKSLGTMIMIEDISAEKRMKSTMARYMDPGVADQLLAAGEGEDIMGGKSSEITVLFSDIRSFTTITESLGAQGTVKMLNEYFTIMVECISREGGMLDKFIGDAIMAGFGLPIPHDDDEDRAVRAGIAMISELWEWNKERVARGDMPIDMGLGLNTDNVVTGNIGSPKRMDYTMIGDGVNLAARLESACKQYAARILISDLTYKKLKGTYRIRDIDRVVVKGKTKPVEIYEVLDYHSEETFPNLMEVVNNFKAGRQHYNKGDFDKAIALFKECLKANEHDKLAQIYIDRCEALITEPPKDWDGVFVMTSK